MNETEFEILCTMTPRGSPLSFSCGGQEVRGTFIGCGEGVVILEANGRQHVWRRELIGSQKSPDPAPSLS